MDVEELRDFCLSLGDDVEEQMPFGAFKAAQEVIAFYVAGHMFCYFDLRSFNVVTVKCQPERIAPLRDELACIGKPYNASPKHWIGIDPSEAGNRLVKELVGNSYQIVKAKYAK